MTTEVVYVCTPDRRRQLLTSLSTLYNSGSSFDRVTIYLVGGEDTDWQFSESSITIKPVPRLFGDFLMGNKIYVCQSKAERVIYLDSDIFVLNSLDPIWEKSTADVMARVASWYCQPGWNSDIWTDTFKTLNVPVVPMMNAGFIMFQNHAHNRIKTIWKKFIYK